MADRDIFVEVAAESQDLLTIDECKLFLNIPLADTSRDEQMQMQIAIASAIIADMTNRKPELGFGETTIVETWREVGNGRLFLMHWPVKEILDISGSGVALVPGDYGFDSSSGKLSVYGTVWKQPAIVRYTGGYKLPEEAPFPLKQACGTLVQEQRIRNQQAQVAGIRQLRHKEAQVAFYDPNALLLKTIGAKTPGVQAAEALTRPYRRFEV